jgi:7-carboxy-7-deazaguanine synthase
MKYALADPSIFLTIQGEGHLAGTTQVFVRLAGCSVGCAGCDTDYRVRHRLSVEDITETIREQFTRTENRLDPWVWITGGEPTDRNLDPLIDALHAASWNVAVATSGVRSVTKPVEWLSVSPHSLDGLKQTFGNEIKLVPGLNGLDAREFIRRWDRTGRTRFWFKFLQPLDGNEDSMRECVDIWHEFPDWGISVQQHKIMGLA